MNNPSTLGPVVPPLMNEYVPKLYTAAGVVVVWVVDPIKRNVVEYRKGAEPRTYEENDTLTVEDVIPGFRLLVGDALKD